MEKEENVIQFDKIVKVIERHETDMPEPTMEVISSWDEGHKQYCPHEQVLLFLHHRLLKCKKCNQVLDPFEFIKKLANEESNHIGQIKYLRHELKWKEKEKADLERQITNLKSQKRKYS